MWNSSETPAFDVLRAGGGIERFSARIPLGSWYFALPAALLTYCVLDLLFLKLAILKLGRNPQGPFPLGYQSSNVPRFILGARVGLTGREVLRKAYEKYKNTSFQIVRSNSQIVVLAPNLLDELTRLPERVANTSVAVEHEFVGSISGLDQIVKSNLHRVILQRKLTPRISLITPALEKTIAGACRQILPDSEDWVEFEPYYAFGQISASAGGCIVSHGLGNDKTWLGISIDYSQATLGLTVWLRNFPLWTQRWLALAMPDFWRTRRCFDRAKKLLAPLINERIAASDSGKWQPRDNDPSDADLLSWVAHMSKGAERNGDFLSRTLVLVAFASVHTTAHHMWSTLLELMEADPALRKELVEEIQELARAGWSPSAYDGMKKMDSVLSEALRLEPPMLTGVRRYFKDGYTFQDGTHVAPGTYVCLATHAISTDESVFADPERFDGLRNYRLRMEREQRREKEHEEEEEEEEEQEEEKLGDAKVKDLLFTTPTPSGLHWGYGRGACPGRFFAGHVLKMVMAKVLLEYEFAYMPGEGRPQTLTLHEFTTILPTQKMLIRRRKGVSAPF